MSRRVPPADLPVKAVLYLRVSTQDQAENGVGIAAQEAKCRALAELRGFVVTSVYRDEGKSGKTDLAARPGLARAIEEVRAALRAGQPAVLLAYSVSRVARSQRVLWSLVDPNAEHPLPLVSATEPFDTSTPMGRAMLGMIAVWSALEADLVSERTRDGLRAVKASGKRLGAPLASVKNPEAVKRIVELRSGGMSLRAIAQTLNREKIPTTTVKRGAKWWVKTVCSALEQAGES